MNTQTSPTLTLDALRLNALVLNAFIAIATASSLASAQNVTATVVGTTPLLDHAYNLALSNDGNNLWVPNSNYTSSPGQISIYSVAELLASPTSVTPVHNIPVGEQPFDLAFSTSGGRAFVNNSGEYTFSVIKIPQFGNAFDSSTGFVEQTVALPLGQINGIRYGNDHIVVTYSEFGYHNAISYLNSPVVALEHPTLLPPVKAGDGEYTGIPAIVETGPQKGAVLIPLTLTGSVYGTGLLLSNLHSGAPYRYIQIRHSQLINGYQVVASPDGNTAYVTLEQPYGKGGVAVVDLKTLKLTTIVETGENYGTGLAISADGKYIVAVGEARSQLTVIDTATNTVAGIITVGPSPFGIALTSDGAHAFVANAGNNTISTVAFSPIL